MKCASVLLTCLAMGSLASAAIAAPQAPLKPDAATSFRYNANATKLSVDGTLVLLSCKPFLATATLAVTQTGIADPTAEFEIGGQGLSSALQKRDIKLELNENRTLKSLNAASAERSGAVITNVLKTVATIATAVFALSSEAPAPEACNADTREALQLTDRLTREIQKRRALLAPVSASKPGDKPVDVKQVGQEIDVLAAQLASVSLTQLTVKVSHRLKVAEMSPATGEVRWAISDLATWMAVDPKKQPCAPVNPALFVSPPKPSTPENVCDRITTTFGLNYTITAVGTPIEAADRAKASPCLLTAADRQASCSSKIALVEPAIATVALTSVNSDYAGVPAGGSLSEVKAPLGQWGRLTWLPLDAKLWKSKTVGFAFDQFGRKQTYAWTSEASAENATSALSDIATSGAAALRAVGGPSDTEEWTKENAEMDAQLKNIQLRTCLTITLNGGACPK